MFSNQDRRSTWSTNGIGDQATVKLNSLLCDPVHVWRVEQFSIVAVRADRLTRQIIGKDEDDIG